MMVTSSFWLWWIKCKETSKTQRVWTKEISFMISLPITHNFLKRTFMNTKLNMLITSTCKTTQLGWKSMAHIMLWTIDSQPPLVVGDSKQVRTKNALKKHLEIVDIMCDSLFWLPRVWTFKPMLVLPSYSEQPYIAYPL
jgi:hypothetical protein